MLENNQNIVSEDTVQELVNDAAPELVNDVMDETVNSQEEPFNPDGEPAELTEEEKRMEKIRLLKESIKTFKPNKHNGKGFSNKFNADYKAKRRKKNKLVKKSRSANYK